MSRILSEGIRLIYRILVSGVDHLCQLGGITQSALVHHILSISGNLGAHDALPFNFLF